MKTLRTFAILTLSLLLFACGTENKSATDNTSELKNQIQVIDFYGTHRCMTCEAIEANTKYTLDTYFSEEQKNGSIHFLTVNVDDDKNYDMAEKYEATGTALFLNVIKEGKETHIDLTDFAFMEGKDQAAFSKQLKEKIEKELKNI